MIDVILDASVVLKWFKSEGETHVDEARAIVAGHARERHRARVLDLTYYELGNVAARRFRWSADHIEQALSALHDICGPGLPLTVEARELAARRAAQHGLSFYDAAYWAVASLLSAPLVTADSELIALGAGEDPAAFASRFRLPRE